MASRRRAIDVELLILLIVLIVLTMAEQTSRRYLNLEMVEVSRTPSAAVAVTEEHRFGAAADPYWAPAHAFPRRPIPVYSSSDEYAPDANPTVHTVVRSLD